MFFLQQLFDMLLHMDKYVGLLINQYGFFAYLLFFMILFCETGLVITPFLPGDSLIFVLGAFAAQGSLDVKLLFFLLAAAAILGDTVNYWLGSFFGETVFLKKHLLKPEHLEKTKLFYDQHGGKTIIIARVIPLVRTFAPFVAGVGKMDYKQFLFYNIIGGITWVAIFLFSGYYLGTIPWVKGNLTLVILFILLISFIPPLHEYLKSRRQKLKN
ncbi:DedA family protein [Candidatus Woesearchaeota archaeon]|nr:DedA family protein [Candidatus Woesearchaeota archaeon]